MAVRVECPGCGREISMKMADVTRLVECAKCWCLFVAVEDSQVPCPGCGSLVSVPFGRAGRTVRCRDCGFVVGERLSRSLLLYVFLVLIGIAAFLTAGIASFPGEPEDKSPPPVDGRRRVAVSVEAGPLDFWRNLLGW